MRREFENVTILYLYSKLSPPENYKDVTCLGGAERIVSEMVYYFRRLRARVIVASDDSDESLVIKNFRENGIMCFRVPFVRKTPLSISIAITKLAHIIKAYNVDIIHSHHRWTTTLAHVVSKTLINRVMIHTSHNIFSNRKYFGKFSGNNITAVSQQVMSNLVDDFNIDKSKISVIYNGIRIETPPQFKIDRLRHWLKIHDDTRVAVVVGRIAEQKGHKYLIDSLPYIVKEFANFKILFVGGVDFGEFELKDYLMQRASDLRVSDYIEFLGHQDDINLYISISEFTILPSLYEGFSLVILESLFLGKPVIATNVGGVPEVIFNGSNGIIVEPRNPEMLASAIIYMLRHEQEVIQMGAMGRKMVADQFTLSKMLDEYAAYYLKLI